MSRPVHVHGAARPPPSRTRPPPSPHLTTSVDDHDDDVEQQRHSSHSASSLTSNTSAAAFDSTGKHKSFSLVSSLRLFYLRSPIRATLLLLLTLVLLVALGLLASSNDSFSLSALSQSLQRSLPSSLSHATPAAELAAADSSLASTSAPASSPSSAVALLLDPSISLATLSVRSARPIDIDRAVYSASSTSSSQLPQFIQSFRAGHLDWHRLLPALPSTSSPALDFEHLVASERATTRLLVYEYNQHSRWQWGSEHGPLAAFTLCPTIGDRCLIHDEEECAHNGLCGWCGATKQCVDRFNAPNPYDAQHSGNCPNPLPALPEVDCSSGRVLHVSGGQMREVEGGESGVAQSGGQCAHKLSDPYLFVDLNNNAAAMYYHFVTEFLQGFYSTHFGRDASQRVKDKYVHLLGRQGTLDQYHDIFGVFTAFCPRYAQHFTASDICFCPQATKDSPPAGGKGALVHADSVVSHIVQALGLADVRPVPHQPSLALISRQYKRFILNELDLVRIAIDQFGFSARLLPIEFMTLYEQVREFRRTNVLAGIHGSGLTNFLFLHPSDRPLNGLLNVGLQLMPWKVTTGATFFSGFASGAGALYKEWSNDRRENAVFHTHFLNERENAQLEDVLNNGAQGGGGNFFAFWINQDTLVDTQAWERLLREIVDA